MPENKFLETEVSKVQKPVSRFGVYWEDISMLQDRKYWVAGSKLTIRDMDTDEIVAERVGFFIESGFGSNAGARTPWQSSKGDMTTCPVFHSFSDQDFLFKALIPAGVK